MKEGIIIGLLIIFVGLASASFDTGNQSQSFQKEYGLNQPIKGWVNISFDNQNINSVFKDNNDETVTLLSLLNNSQNSGYEYECSTRDCNSDYSASNGETEKIFDLNSGETKILGLRIVGNVESINEIKFDVSSNSPSTCYNPLKIEVFDNLVFANEKTTGELCSGKKSYGCFDANSQIEEAEITTKPYCERINLSDAPAFRLGAWIKEEQSGTKKIYMDLYDENDKIASCEIANKSGTGEQSCEINYSLLDPGEYYACIKASSAGTGTYKIHSSLQSAKCGFFNIPVEEETAAYQIFAQSEKYASFGTVSLNNSFFDEDLSEAALDFIDNKYGSLNCSLGCVLPIKITSYVTQQIALKNLYLSYEKDTGVVSGNIDLFDVVETPAKISSDFQKLYIDEANFSSQSSAGNFTFRLYLDDEKVLEEKMVSGRIPVINSLTPLIAAAGLSTEFTVKVNSTYNITKYTWKIENTVKQTTTNKLSYTFNDEGSFEVEINVTDSNKKSSIKTFTIVVGNPASQINNTISKKLSDLSRIKTQISAFDAETQDKLTSLLEISNNENALKNLRVDLQKDYPDYPGIISRLNSIQVPESVGVGVVLNDLTFLPDDSVIDPFIVNEVYPGNYNEELYDQYLNSIVAWNLNNITSKISMAEFDILISGEKKTLKMFELDINNQENQEYYLFIKDLSDLSFMNNYSAIEEQGYTYLTLSGNNKIVFSTTENVDFTNLPVFISPGIDDLGVRQINIGPNQNDFNIWLYVIILGILIVVWFIVYTVLYNWYKYKYETHLFNNRNNLLNLVMYINNEKRSGVKDSEIEKQLRKTKWTSEQINYAMKKYSGKRTGMIEIPFFKIFSQKSKENTTLRGYYGMRNVSQNYPPKFAF